MRRVAAILAAVIVVCSSVPAAAATPDGYGLGRARECLAAMQLGVQTPGSYVVLPNRCGSIHREVVQGATGTCETQYGTVAGVIVWSLSVCESWTWDGTAITEWMDPPDASTFTRWPFSASELKSGWQWMQNPWHGRAWASAKFTETWAGINIGSFVVNLNLHLYGNGTVYAG